MKKIILISGKAEHGKDTLAEMMAIILDGKGFSSKIAKFGDILKMIAKDFYGWKGDKDVDGRALLQNAATEIRNVAGKQFFANTLVDILASSCKNIDFIMIPDNRYEEEFESINNGCKKLGISKEDVIKIRVERPGFENKLTKKQRNHDSETSLDTYTGFNYYVVTDSLQEKAIEANKILEVLINGN